MKRTVKEDKRGVYILYDTYKFRPAAPGGYAPANTVHAKGDQVNVKVGDRRWFRGEAIVGGETWRREENSEYNKRG